MVCQKCLKNKVTPADMFYMCHECRLRHIDQMIASMDQQFGQYEKNTSK